MHFLRREGRLFIRIFPHKPVSAKPLEVRMGKGKGEPEYWVRRREARHGDVRDQRRRRADRQAGPGPRRPQDAGPDAGSSPAGTRWPKSTRSELSTSSCRAEASNEDQRDRDKRRRRPRRRAGRAAEAPVRPAQPGGHREAGRPEPARQDPQGHRPDQDGHPSAEIEEGGEANGRSSRPRRARTASGDNDA